MIGFNEQRRPKKRIGVVHVLLLLALLVFLVTQFSRESFTSRNLWITEVMSSNLGTIADEDGDYPDWIEIHNSGRQAIDLAGFWLSDDPTNPMKWAFPDISIGPGEYLLVFASGKNRSDAEGGSLHTGFRLSSSGETIVLSTPDLRVVDSVELEPMLTNVALGRVPGSTTRWAYYLDPTPGQANGALFYDDIDRTPLQGGTVYINEFMAANGTGILDEDRDRPDWIELFNSGTEPVDLTGYWLSDRADNPFRWRVPAVVIGPGDYLLVLASGKDRRDPATEYLHTSFKLALNDEHVVFSDPRGRLINEIAITDMIVDISYGRDRSDPSRWLYYPAPTPGMDNFTQGFPELSGIRSPGSSQVHINEVVSRNLGTLADEDGDNPDWLELYNSGDAPVRLAGFGLSDNQDEPFRWVFPDVEIDPGDFLLVFASGKDRQDPEARLHTNFSLAAGGETLILTGVDGMTLDVLSTGALEANLSVGRQPDGIGSAVLFTRPTPGASNSGDAKLGFARPPVTSHRSGFYDETITVSLSLSPWEPTGAVLRYTLDGKEPDSSSPVYSEPLTVTKTTVLRARVFTPGFLPSVTINSTYLVNDNTDLSVLSILMDPKDLWDYYTGIYVMGPRAEENFPYVGANFWQDWEKPMHFQLFEPDGTLGFSFDAGIMIGGQYSRAVPQKTFNIFARNEYGSNVMEYPFFPDKELTTYKALTLRQSGQDWNMSMIRDTFMTSLLAETDLDYQAYRPVVVYINGAYWGIYNIRERINEHYIAYNHDVDPTKIDMLQGNNLIRVGSGDDYAALTAYIDRNDMRNPDHYAYVQTKMDVTNYIDYWITQIYFGNTDSANIRFWREQSDEGKWRWIVYDLDWGFFTWNHNTLVYVTHPAGTGYASRLSTTIMYNLMQNNDFRQEFVERLAYHMNHTFTKERVLARIDERVAEIESEVPRHLARWNLSMANWQSHVSSLRTYAEARTDQVLGYVQRYFRLSNEEMRIFDAWTR
ncbi:MAG TPA: lamin tail domain-containing protein [Bacillota bacterium]|nr:lamin tail domain-containing protein [Bacillota bacterium]